jgi:hypothetical protein
MTRNLARRQFDLDCAGLLNLWRTWNPVAGEGEADEYECQAPPMLRLLHGGASQAELTEFLSRELPNHFGIEPKSHDAFAARVLSWWEEREIVGR